MRIFQRLHAAHGVFSLAAVAATALVQGAALAPPPGQNLAQMQFAEFPGMPTCSTGAVQSGDPGKGASIIAAKAATGCVFPWHWHTPNEHLMMVSGTARLEMKDAEPVTLKAGGFALMPAHHVHQFHCLETCVLYVFSDLPFDMHYVDDKGQELTPDEALKRVKETAAQPPK